MRRDTAPADPAASMTSLSGRAHTESRDSARIPAALKRRNVTRPRQTAPAAGVMLARCGARWRPRLRSSFRWAPVSDLARWCSGQFIYWKSDLPQTVAQCRNPTAGFGRFEPWGDVALQNHEPIPYPGHTGRRFSGPFVCIFAPMLLLRDLCVFLVKNRRLRSCGFEYRTLDHPFLCCTAIWPWGPNRRTVPGSPGRLRSAHSDIPAASSALSCITFSCAGRGAPLDIEKWGKVRLTPTGVFPRGYRSVRTASGQSARNARSYTGENSCLVRRRWRRCAFWCSMSPISFCMRQIGSKGESLTSHNGRRPYD